VKLSIDPIELIVKKLSFCVSYHKIIQILNYITQHAFIKEIYLAVITNYPLVYYYDCTANIIIDIINSYVIVKQINNYRFQINYIAPLVSNARTNASNLLQTLVYDHNNYFLPLVLNFETNGGSTYTNAILIKYNYLIHEQLANFFVRSLKLDSMQIVCTDSFALNKTGIVVDYSIYHSAINKEKYRTTKNESIVRNIKLSNSFINTAHTILIHHWCQNKKNKYIENFICTILKPMTYTKST
jgi:hypothetical protein